SSLAERYITLPKFAARIFVTRTALRLVAPKHNPPPPGGKRHAFIRDWLRREPNEKVVFCQVLERAKGIEPSYEAWEASVLPLNYARSSPSSDGRRGETRT